MPQGDKSSKAKQKRASDRSNASNGPARPELDARARAAVNKLPGDSRRMAARRKLPSGPLGGSGRKSNVPRSS